VQDSPTTLMRFETPTTLALEAAFDGGRITSDGGLIWLGEAEEQLRVCERIASHIPEWRGASVRHSLVRLVRQRVFQIAAGYEDQNDSDTLRNDPLLKLVCAEGCRRARWTWHKPTHHLSPAERARCPLVAAHGSGARGALHRGAGQGGLTRACPSGLRRNGRSRPRRSGRRLLPRLLPRAHPPPLVGLRRGHGATLTALLRAGNTHASRAAHSRS
jgi:hypothetical protein